LKDYLWFWVERVRGEAFVRGMTKTATVAPTHNMMAAAHAADEKAGEDARNFQNSPSIEVSMHANAIYMR